jgi:orotate phosphoribosyltransferase-like protein
MEDRPYTTQEANEIGAQRLACALLVEACRSASFDFGVNSTYARSAREERLNRRAAQIVNDVIASWRETLAIIETIEANQSWPGEIALEAQRQQVDSSALAGPRLP